MVQIDKKLKNLFIKFIRFNALGAPLKKKFKILAAHRLKITGLEGNKQFGDLLLFSITLSRRNHLQHFAADQPTVKSYTLLS